MGWPRPWQSKLFNTDLCQTDIHFCLFAAGIKRATSWLSSSLGWSCQKSLVWGPSCSKGGYYTIHTINLYPVDKYQGNQLHDPLDRDLSVSLILIRWVALFNVWSWTSGTRETSLPKNYTFIVINNKNELCKTVGLTSYQKLSATAICFNLLLDVWSSLPFLYSLCS